MSDHIDSKRAVRGVRKALAGVEELLKAKDREIAMGLSDVDHWRCRATAMEKKMNAIFDVRVGRSYEGGPSIRRCTLDVNLNEIDAIRDFPQLVMEVARQLAEGIRRSR